MRHQSAGHPNCCMKKVQSFSFGLSSKACASSCIATLLTTCTSQSPSHSHSYLFCIRPLRFSQKRECLQSMISKANGNMTLLPQGFSLVWAIGTSSGGPMIDFNRKLIEKFKRRDNRFCFFHNRLSPKN